MELPEFKPVLIVVFLIAVVTLAASELFDSEGMTAEAYFLKEVAAAKSVDVEPGDTCIVSGNVIDHSTGTVLEVRGRRVPMMNEALSEFRANPENYFSELQARGGLFSESFLPPRPQYKWFFFGVLATLLILSAGLAGAGAIRRGLDPGKWFLAGLSGNIFSFVQLRSKGEELSDLPGGLAKIPNTPQPAICPSCDAFNHPSANTCSTCKTKLEPAYESEKSRV